MVSAVVDITSIAEIIIDQHDDLMVVIRDTNPPMDVTKWVEVAPHMGTLRITIPFTY